MWWSVPFRLAWLCALEGVMPVGGVGRLLTNRQVSKNGLNTESIAPAVLGSSAISKASTAKVIGVRHRSARRSVSYWRRPCFQSHRTFGWSFYLPDAARPFPHAHFHNQQQRGPDSQAVLSQRCLRSLAM